jgi:glycerate kinase
MNVLIIPDKFKGTLTAQAAAEAMERGWRQARPADELELIPMSDGGDGFGELLSAQIQGKARKIKTLDAADQAVSATWWWEVKTKTAIVEAARVVGLAMLPPGKYHPFQLNTFGLGKVLHQAATAGARTCIVGIGGSATNDAGTGMARALGWKFLDEQGQAIEDWTEMRRLSNIVIPRRRKIFPKLVVAVDVQNRLLGPQGCSRVYGPQKGLRPEDFPKAEGALKRLAQVCEKVLGVDYAKQPGAGAAGGLGFGLMAFAGAEMAPGFALFARRAGLNERLRKADLVITGEGAIDHSTLMGKGVGELALLCRKAKVPCLGLAGYVSEPEKAKQLFAETHGLTEITSIAEAKARAAHWLERLTQRAAKQKTFTAE